MPGLFPRTLEVADSSQIKKMQYHPTKLVLWVTFANKDTYEYSGVPRGLFGQVASAESIGSAFAAQIKPKYTGRKIGS